MSRLIWFSASQHIKKGGNDEAFEMYEKL